MKSGKRPTRKQKMAMLAASLNPNHWLVVKNHIDHGYLVIVHRGNGTTKNIQA